MAQNDIKARLLADFKAKIAEVNRVIGKGTNAELEARLNELNNIGLHCYNAQGAFYVFADITSTGMTSSQFALELLREQHLLVIPGTAFGEAGEGFVRISYSYSLDHLMEGTGRIADFLRKLKK